MKNINHHNNSDSKLIEHLINPSTRWDNDLDYPPTDEELDLFESGYEERILANVYKKRQKIEARRLAEIQRELEEEKSNLVALQHEIEIVRHQLGKARLELEEENRKLVTLQYETETVQRQLIKSHRELEEERQTFRHDEVADRLQEKLQALLYQAQEILAQQEVSNKSDNRVVFHQSTKIDRPRNIVNLTTEPGVVAPLLESSNSCIDARTGIEMIRIPPGKFYSSREKQPYDLPEYWIAKSPITNKHYERFVKDIRYSPPSCWKGTSTPANIANKPVVNISWRDALAYCQWAEMQLPTEDQWEKAAQDIDVSLDDDWFEYQQDLHNKADVVSLVWAYMWDTDNFREQEPACNLGARITTRGRVKFLNKYKYRYSSLSNSDNVGFRVVSYDMSKRNRNINTNMANIVL